MWSPYTVCVGNKISVTGSDRPGSEIKQITSRRYVMTARLSSETLACQPRPRENLTFPRFYPWFYDDAIEISEVGRTQDAIGCLITQLRARDDPLLKHSVGYVDIQGKLPAVTSLALHLLGLRYQNMKSKEDPSDLSVLAFPGRINIHRHCLTIFQGTSRFTGPK